MMMRWWALLGIASLSSNAVATEIGPVYTGSSHDFVAAHGERALVMGYPTGLEVWAYPLQLMSGYRLSFRVTGQVEPVDGATLLKTTEHRPFKTVRIYVGPDFVVREYLFVPRREAAAIIRFEVEGRPEVLIDVHFKPSLDLMWPGALGGQTIGWDEGVGGYVEREAIHHLAATVVSPDTVEHDATVNRTRPSIEMNLVLAPRGSVGKMRTAAMYVLGKAATAADLSSLARRSDLLHAEAATHTAALLSRALQVVTPDQDVNRALASALLALDQAWICSDALGCGIVAGYGPSRPGRRPQYAWFFAGDGLVAVRGLLAVGEYARAREELAFIARYQDRRTGMIWHELSQSASLIDWSRYPYMFVHVDISYQYLVAVAAYVRTSGDSAFARATWPSLAGAWRYCTSLVDPSGLPRIPIGKEGQNEQDALRDDIRLSSLWIEAADGFAQLAEATGHTHEASVATTMAEHTRRTLGTTGWDNGQDFWLSGHTPAGTPVHGARPDAGGVLLQGVFTPTQIDHALDRLAAPEFVTDWGIRSLSAAAPDYDPNLYGSGSVWALGTAGTATVFWQAHRPLPAFGLWQGLVAWNDLDSGGHLHEVLAGDLFHPEVESVPEQTWSSASLLTSTVEGLLGLAVRSAEGQIDFAPHLPAAWPDVTLRNIAVGDTRLTLSMRHDARSIDLDLDNPGIAVSLTFAPEVPLGAGNARATLDGAAIAVMAEPHPQDMHVRTHFIAPPGTSHLHIDLTGGVTVEVPAPALLPGTHSRGLKIADTVFASDTLAITGWITAPEQNVLLIQSSRKLRAARGAEARSLGGGRYAVCVASGNIDAQGAAPFTAYLDFGRELATPSTHPDTPAATRPVLLARSPTGSAEELIERPSTPPCGISP